jgi:hypothetical protein
MPDDSSSVDMLVPSETRFLPPLLFVVQQVFAELAATFGFTKFTRSVLIIFFNPSAWTCSVPTLFVAALLLRWPFGSLKLESPREVC